MATQTREERVALIRKEISVLEDQLAEKKETLKEINIPSEAEQEEFKKYT